MIQFSYPHKKGTKEEKKEGSEKRGRKGRKTEGREEGRGGKEEFD